MESLLIGNASIKESEGVDRDNVEDLESDLHERREHNVILELLSLPNQIQWVLRCGQSPSKRSNVSATHEFSGAVE